MSVPYSIIISDKTIDDGINSIKSRKKRKEFRKIKNRETRLVVFCLYEMSRGGKSKWAPFFDILKNHVTISLPRTFTDTELDALHDEIAKNDALRRRSLVVEEYGKYATRLRTIFSSMKNSPDFESWISLENFMRWEAKLLAISLMIQGERILVPVANFISYAYDSEPQEHDFGNTFLKYHKQMKSSFNIHADRNMLPGSNVVENYGDNSNFVYLQHHGFVPRINPADCVRVAMPFDDKNEPRVKGQSTRLKLLANVADIKDIYRRDPIWCIRPSEPLRDPMLFYLRVLEMSEEALDRCRDKIQGTKGDDAKMAALRCVEHDVENDRRVYNRLSRLLRRTLYKAPTSLEEDEQLLRTSMDAGLNANERLAVQYRISRKRLLSQLNAMLERVSSEDDASCELENQGMFLE